MKLCFAGTCMRKNLFQYNLHNLKFVLESFYYVKPWQTEQIKNLQFFVLDSGAFTFMNKGVSSLDLTEYVDRYAAYIKDNDVRYFFELDIDNLIGYEEVKKIRYKLERKTKRRCIPVWHKSRGIKEFQVLCKKYDYIAIGGIATKEISSNEYFLLNALCDYAHSQNCKIHGLGFTPKNLRDYKFDSVDSTSWMSGGRFGQRHTFKNGEIIISKPKERMSYQLHDQINIPQWVLYQDFLEVEKM